MWCLGSFHCRSLAWQGLRWDRMSPPPSPTALIAVGNTTHGIKSASILSHFSKELANLLDRVLPAPDVKDLINRTDLQRITPSSAAAADSSPSFTAADHDDSRQHFRLSHGGELYLRNILIPAKRKEENTSKNTAILMEKRAAADAPTRSDKTTVTSITQTG